MPSPHRFFKNSSSIISNSVLYTALVSEDTNDDSVSDWRELIPDVALTGRPATMRGRARRLPEIIDPVFAKTGSINSGTGTV